ncbi:MAG TPA: hypothetical protein VGN11_12340 [Candidatus Baltobacteraceae bacterium]|nr:hypothetical protein [Candidatus Baltobacteraceae bacterium]
MPSTPADIPPASDNGPQTGPAAPTPQSSPSDSSPGTTGDVLPGQTPAPSGEAIAPVSASSGNVATFHGCRVFAAGGYYNAPVTTAAVDPNSAKYISSIMRAGDTAGFYASTGVERVNLATNATPMRTVKKQVSYHSFPGPYPWASGFYIEPLGDKHAMVVQTQDCRLYEAYGTTFSGSTLSAYSGAQWDMRKVFVPMSAGSPSAMASGLSIFAGMVKWEDYQSGAINHALNWAAIAHTVAQYQFVRPASDTDSLASRAGSYPMPYGAHLRLKASFSTAGWGPQARMVAAAMKTYGVYLSDTGSSANALYFARASDGSNPWSWRDLSALSKIHLSDFDVIKLPAVQRIPGH